MIKPCEEIIHFFKKQHYTIVTTIGASGLPHNSCKAVVDMEEGGRVYLLDLYMGATYNNLKNNGSIAVTAVDEHRFKGFCLKGRARIVRKEDTGADIIEAWQKKISGRITKRLLKNIAGDRGHAHHPEALLPKPAYLILMEVEEMVDLTPHHIKNKEVA